MKTTEIVKKLETIPAGRFFRIRYMSQLPLTAEYKKQGYSLCKIVDTTTRTGVSYKNIEGVQLKEDYTPRESNWEWVVKDRIKMNKKTGKQYAVLAPVAKGNNTKKSYILTTPEGITNTCNEGVARMYTTKSYWAEKERPAVITVTLENIMVVK